MATLLSQRPKKSVYQRGVVVCRKCASPIPVYRLKGLAEEFSVTCPKCRDRGIYSQRAMSVEMLPERRKKPRK
jgi:hypothetical protein